MDDQQTCGQGRHVHLELDDEPAREEHAVYLRLVEEQRQTAGRLRAVASPTSKAAALTPRPSSTATCAIGAAPS